MHLETIETSRLAVACEVSGPAGGAAALLLHGWPDDARTWDRVLPALHAAGLQTFVPYIRGFGPTRFRRPGTMRSGQLAALGQDALDLINALGFAHLLVVGHDWGARAAYIAASLAPQRVSGLVALSVGWGTNVPGQRLSFRQVQNYWYHWYMALDRGAELVSRDRVALTRYLWTIWNAGWAVSDEEFAATARSFENPDWAQVTIHSYRHRWGLAPSDPDYAAIEAQIAASPMIAVPTLVIHGGADPCNDPSTSEGKDEFFTAGYRRTVLPGIGHFPQRQAAATVADLIASHAEGRPPSSPP